MDFICFDARLFQQCPVSSIDSDSCLVAVVDRACVEMVNNAANALKQSGCAEAVEYREVYCP